MQTHFYISIRDWMREYRTLNAAIAAAKWRSLSRPAICYEVWKELVEDGWRVCDRWFIGTVSAGVFKPAE